MGAAMDPAVLKAGFLAHIKTINAAISPLVASVPAVKTLDVYGVFSKLVTPEMQAYLPRTVNAADAQTGYNAFLEFKDVVKAFQR
jgi:hypothetical protein